MRSTAGRSSPGSKTATTIVSLDVSIPKWIAPADVTLGMTAGSLPPLRRRYLDCSHLPASGDPRLQASRLTGGHLGAGRLILTPERVAVHAPDQRKRVAVHHDRGRIGGNPPGRGRRTCRAGTASHLAGCVAAQ